MAELTLRLDDCGTLSPVPFQDGTMLCRAGTRVAYAFDLVTTRAAFDALEAEWNDLFARAGEDHQVFQTFNWCWHWCNAFLGTGTRLSIVTARQDGRLVLVLPLVLERNAVLSRLVWLGEPVSQYGDALVDRVADRDGLLRAAWSHLTSHVRADVAQLRKVREDAAITPLLRSIGAVVTASTAAPALDLASAPDCDSYEQRYSAKARKNRRRLMRRLEEQVPVAVETLEEGAEAATLAVHAIGLKRAWLDERRIYSPALADPRTMRFFAAVAGDASRRTGCRVSVLRAGSVPAGIQVGFACKGRLALHVIVYDLRCEKSGVGVLHLERAIRDGYAAGHHTLDLLAPNDSYKMDWADGVVGVHDIAVPVSRRGTLFTRIYLGPLRERLKVLAQRMPTLARGTASLRALL